MNRVGRSFVLTTAGAITLALGCAKDLVANEGDGSGGGGSGGTPAASAVTGDIAGEVPSHCLPDVDIEGTLWGANSTDCPMQSPRRNDACDGPSDVSCAYLGDEGSCGASRCATLCACLYDRNAGEKRWLCEDSRNLSPECPESLPEDGVSCFGARGSTCRYPLPEATTCECGGTDDPLWSCDPDENQNTLPLAPEDVDPNTPVAQLTNAEQNSFCEWVEGRERGGVGFAPRGPAEVSADGFTQGGCGFRHEFGDTFVWPTVSQAQCAANLALSSCDAPLSELADCVLAMTEGPFAHARSCGPYAARQSCNGTMIWAYNDCHEEVNVDQGCRLQVE